MGCLARAVCEMLLSCCDHDSMPTVVLYVYKQAGSCCNLSVFMAAGMDG